MSNMPNNPYASPKEQGGYQQTGIRPLASRMDRFLGAFVDGLVMIVPALVMGFVLGLVLAAFVDITTFSGNLILTAISGVFGIGLFLAINGYFLATKGQTVGKMAVKTQIVAEDGSLVPLAPLILKRYLPFWLLGLIPYLGLLNLVNILMIFRENKKCLHDDIAGTKVISLKISLK